MSKYEVTVSGCDDSSTVVLELDDSQLEAIKMLESEINKLDIYTCTPSIEVERIEKL